LVYVLALNLHSTAIENLNIYTEGRKLCPIKSHG
jgi:hypothetical protein